MAKTLAVLVVLIAGLNDRPAYVSSVFNAVKAMDAGERRALVQKLRGGARSRCRAAFSTPDVNCILDVARDVCAAEPATSRAACRLVADVAMINFLAEREWVDKKTRVNIMNASDDFQAGMRKELRARYSGLVTELTMFKGFTANAGLAASIDRFCVARAKKRVLTWSRCVAAIVWYIAISPRSNGRQNPRD